MRVVSETFKKRWSANASNYFLSQRVRLFRWDFLVQVHLKFALFRHTFPTQVYSSKRTRAKNPALGGWACSVFFFHASASHHQRFRFGPVNHLFSSKPRLKNSFGNTRVMHIELASSNARLLSLLPIAWSSVRIPSGNYLAFFLSLKWKHFRYWATKKG